MKRLFDFELALVADVVLVLPIEAVALAARLTSPGLVQFGATGAVAKTAS